eukprot:5807060-Pleurochrysis_carterae.AAC.1
MQAESDRVSEREGACPGATAAAGLSTSLLTAARLAACAAASAGRLAPAYTFGSALLANSGTLCCLRAQAACEARGLAAAATSEVRDSKATSSSACQ